MARCDNCGAEVFVGERHCPMCRAPILEAEPPSGGLAPPPEGLGLIIGKHRADQESMQRGPDTHERLLYGERPSMDESIDEVARALKPQRDAQGKVVWDVKHAIVGAIVVAIVVGLVTWYLVWRFSAVTSGFSGIGQPR